MNRVLLIDDDRDSQKVLAAFLGRKDYQVTPAANAEDARRLLRENAFDLIVIDWYMPLSDREMPVRGGLEFLKELRESGAGSSAPIVVLTAWDDYDQRMEGLQLGVKEVLAKPQTCDAILNFVERWIGENDSATPQARPAYHGMMGFGAAAGQNLDCWRGAAAPPM